MQPHVVLIGAPAPGHAIPFAALAKLLAGNGIQVTYLCSGQVSEKLQHLLGKEEGISERIAVTSIVEDPVLEPDHPGNLVPWVQKESDEKMAALTEHLIRGLTPPPCCMITDMFFLFPVIVAKNLQLPRHFFCTMSAGTLAFMLTVPKFEDQGLFPVEKASTSTNFFVPGVGIIPPSDLWEYFNVPFNQTIADCCRRIAEAADTATIIINSSEELETETFETLQKPESFHMKVKSVLPIGPLLPSFAIHNGSESIDEVIDGLYEDNKDLPNEVKMWLDAQPPRSVLYINFGSIFSPNAEQIKEIAYGVEASEQRFLWILRPPESPQVIISKQSFNDEITNLLPPGFEERTKGHGLLIHTWAQQLQILAHKAIGMFLSHCGWNSTLESIGAAIPILTMPQFVDQRMNARWITEKTKCGIVLKRFEDEFERKTIERKVRSMSEGEEGQEVRRRIKTLNGLMRKSLSTTGSSKLNLQKYIDSLHTLTTQLTKCTNHDG